jgi:streptogramin lyase
MIRSAVSLVLLSVLLAACAHSNGTLPLSPTLSSEGVITTSVVNGGTFVHYRMPAGVQANSIANGPYNTLWFPGEFLTPTQTNVYVFNKGTGHVSTLSFASLNEYVDFGGPMISAGGSMWFIGAIPQAEDTNALGRVNTSNDSFSFTDAGADDTYFLSNFALGSNGRVWFATCSEPCGPSFGLLESFSPLTGALGPAIPLEDGYVGTAVAAGPGGNLYLTELGYNVIANVPPAALDVISTQPAILHHYALPANSNPSGITEGHDGNLWVTEPGINKIARVTPSGTITQFKVPTPNAGLRPITYAWDLGLWFSETNAHKLGHITTSGAITEYPLPAGLGGPGELVTCNSTACPPHGGVWFAAGGAVGKFIAP